MPKFLTSSHPDRTQPTGLESMDIPAFINKFDHFLFDCDGVLWLGSQVIPGIPETLNWLRSQGKKLLFVTNNSSKTRTNYLKKFEGMGIPVKLEEIFSSAYAAAIYIQKVVNLPKDKKVFVIGMAGIKGELDEANIPHFSLEDKSELITDDHEILQYKPDPQVGAVLVGIDRNINYRKYCQAYQYLKYNSECLFLGTNDDSTFPTSGTFYPGTGAILAPLITSLDMQPKLLGKPSLTMLEAILAAHPEIDLKRACMVGDRLNTDIQFGVDGQLGGTLLVLTGVTQLPHLVNSKVQPGFIIDSLAHLQHP